MPHGHEVDPTWASRDLPVLAAAYLRYEADRQPSVSQLEEIRVEVGLPVRAFETALDALATADPPYLDYQTGGGWSDDRAGGGYIDSITERTRRELGAWPTPDNLVEELVAALLRAADKETSEAEKGRLRAAAEVIGGMARDIAVGVVTTRLGQLARSSRRSRCSRTLLVMG